MPADNYQPSAAGDPKVKYRLEPPQAQQIYAVLDGVVSSVLTNRNAALNSLLSKAETKVNGILANAECPERARPAPGAARATRETELRGPAPVRAGPRA